MNLVIWLIYAAVALTAIIFTGLRELHMLQLNGYKTPEHSWWMKKNFKRYILPLTLFVTQYVLCFTGVVSTIGRVLIGLFCCLNVIFIIANKPGKKFKKPLVYTARVKRMMTTFFILIAVYFTIAVLLGYDTAYGIAEGNASAEKKVWFEHAVPFILAGSALYLTPILVPLSNLINKPIETAINHWYINDAKKKLASMPELHKVGITGSYGKTSMKFYLSELLS